MDALEYVDVDVDVDVKVKGVDLILTLIDTPVDSQITGVRACTFVARGSDVKEVRRP